MSRRLVLVHAHPDDETLGTGGTIARYSSEGAHVCLITCTNGEAGEIADVPGLGPPEEIRPKLGEVRRAELIEACRRLGTVDLRMLGYHDSGMQGTPENDAPVAFVNQDLEEVARRIAVILEEIRPQVLITYNEFGGYGHPDHIRAHQAAVRAAALTQVPKLYHTAFPKGLMRAGSELAASIGIDMFSEEDIETIGTDDADVTSVVDCTAFVTQKFAALEAHRTQLGTTQMFLQIPEEFRSGFGLEHYVLAISKVPRRDGIESDLFEGTGA